VLEGHKLLKLQSRRKVLTPLQLSQPGDQNILIVPESTTGGTRRKHEVTWKGRKLWPSIAFW
jgi:hypothetical protein